jgi:hypothetical protein
MTSLLYVTLASHLRLVCEITTCFLTMACPYCSTSFADEIGLISATIGDLEEQTVSDVPYYQKIFMAQTCPNNHALIEDIQGMQIARVQFAPVVPYRGTKLHILLAT